MPWPLQCQVPPAAFAMSAISVGGFISGIAPASALGGVLASGALGAILGSAALVSALGCAAASPVMPTITIATRENVFIVMLLGGKTRALYSNARSRHRIEPCSVATDGPPPKQACMCGSRG